MTSSFLCPHRRRDERLDLQWSLEGHQLGVVSVDISHTLPIAASSSLDAHIRLWDLENGKQIKSIDAGPGKGFALGQTAARGPFHSLWVGTLREASRCLNCTYVTHL